MPSASACAGGGWLRVTADVALLFCRLMFRLFVGASVVLLILDRSWAVALMVGAGSAALHRFM